ncbi:MAG: hypothetical protein ABSA15_01180 [Thermoplasmata archaeon]
MPDIDTFLLSIQERDKWRSRVERLQEGLREAREQRRRMERQLSRVKKDIAHLRDFAVGPAETHLDSEHAARNFPFGR